MVSVSPNNGVVTSSIHVYTTLFIWQYSEKSPLYYINFMRATKNAFAQSDKGPHCSPDANYKVLILFSRTIKTPSLTMKTPRLSALAFFAAHMSRNVRKRAFGHVSPAKIQISLRILAVSSQSSQGAFWLAKDANFLNADNEDWPKCPDAQADLSLYWLHISEDTFSSYLPRHVFEHSLTAKTQIRLCICAVWSGPTLFANRKNETIECGKCLDLNAHARNESNSVHFMFVRKLFAWRGPYMGLNRQHFHSALLFSADSRRAVVSFCRKNAHNTG